MNNSDQLYINHEVRLQVLEEVAKDTKEMRKEMHTQFRWTVTMFMTILLANIGLFGGLILAKLL